jgi:hypothetical protein
VSLTYSYVSFGVGKGSIYFLARFFYRFRDVAYAIPKARKTANTMINASIAQ